MQSSCPGGFYGRLVDDAIIIHDPAQETTVHSVMDGWHQNICWEHGSYSMSTPYLDLQIFLEPKDNHASHVSWKMFRKPQNACQYIPPVSAHHDSVFRGFIAGELHRITRNNQNREKDVRCDVRFFFRMLHEEATIDHGLKN